MKQKDAGFLANAAPSDLRFALARALRERDEHLMAMGYLEERAVSAEAKKEEAKRAGLQAREREERHRESLGLLCPHAEVCETCPCADEDDACFPGERLRAERDYWKAHAEEVEEVVGSRAEAALAEARELLRRLAEWDMMEATGDGAYWKAEIARVRAALASSGEEGNDG